jgi:hypothetical protein
MVEEIRKLVWGNQKVPQESPAKMVWATKLIAESYFSYNELVDIAWSTNIKPNRKKANQNGQCPSPQAKGLEDDRFCPGKAVMEKLKLCHTSRPGDKCECIQ